MMAMQHKIADESCFESCLEFMDDTLSGGILSFPYIMSLFDFTSLDILRATLPQYLQSGYSIFNE